MCHTEREALEKCGCVCCNQEIAIELGMVCAVPCSHDACLSQLGDNFICTNIWKRNPGWAAPWEQYYLQDEPSMCCFCSKTVERKNCQIWSDVVVMCNECVEKEAKKTEEWERDHVFTDEELPF